MSRTLNARWINQSRLRQHVGPTGDGKRAFDTKEDAAEFAERKSTESHQYHAYRCRFCKRFHIGH